MFDGSSVTNGIPNCFFQKHKKKISLDKYY